MECDGGTVIVLRYSIKRLLSIIPVLLIVVFILNFIVYLTPGSPAASILGMDADPGAISELNQAMGYDKPLLTQYFSWLSHAIRGDFGNSIFMKQPVLTAVKEHLVPTLKIIIMGEFFALLFAVPLGILSAYFVNSKFDHIMSNLSLVQLAVPSFLVALLLMLFFGNYLQWFPVSGYKPLSDGFWQNARYLILPSLSIAIAQFASFFQIIRTSMLGALRQPYIKTARAKGANEKRVVVVHSLRNASLPILTTIGQTFGLLVAGSVVIEYIFVIPGMGQLMYNAVTRRDIPVILGAVFIVALIYVILNFIIDLLYCILDKRVNLDS